MKGTPRLSSNEAALTSHCHFCNTTARVGYNKLVAGICKRMPSSPYLTERTTRRSNHLDQRTPDCDRRPRRADLYALRSSGAGAHDHVRISVRGFQSEA